MVDDEQGHAFHFGGSGETDDGFAVAIRAEAERLPGLGGDFSIGGGDFEHAFIALRVGSAAALGFGDDLAGVLGEGWEG